MIFLTVGHQTPFDRLVRLVDDWAARSGAQVFAQIGPAKYRPRHMEWTEFLRMQEFEQRLDRCTAIVSHAGTGTIIQGLLRKKPMLVLPRLASLGETRNDHQVGTAQYFEASGQIRAAYDDSTFVRLLGDIQTLPAGQSVSDSASAELIDRLRRFLNETPSASRVTSPTNPSVPGASRG